jgi:hypothetical protein
VVHALCTRAQTRNPRFKALRPAASRKRQDRFSDSAFSSCATCCKSRSAFCNWNVKSQAKALTWDVTCVFITLSGNFFRKYSQRQATSSGRSGDRDRKRSNASLKFAAISGRFALSHCGVLHYCILQLYSASIGVQARIVLMSGGRAKACACGAKICACGARMPLPRRSLTFRGKCFSKAWFLQCKGRAPQSFTLAAQRRAFAGKLGIKSRLLYVAKGFCVDGARLGVEAQGNALHGEGAARSLA